MAFGIRGICKTLRFEGKGRLLKCIFWMLLLDLNEKRIHLYKIEGCLIYKKKAYGEITKSFWMASPVRLQNCNTDPTFSDGGLWL